MSQTFPLMIKRVYESAENQDGMRVLVDRLWPRGISREALKLDLWAKVLCPSNELRKAYHSGALSFEAFSQAYRLELDSNPKAEAQAHAILEALKKGPVSLLYAAKNQEENHAMVLRDWLMKKTR